MLGQRGGCVLRGNYSNIIWVVVSWPCWRASWLYVKGLPHCLSPSLSKRLSNETRMGTLLRHLKMNAMSAYNRGKPPNQTAWLQSKTARYMTKLCSRIPASTARVQLAPLSHSHLDLKRVLGRVNCRFWECYRVIKSAATLRLTPTRRHTLGSLEQKTRQPVC